MKIKIKILKMQKINNEIFFFCFYFSGGDFHGKIEFYVTVAKNLKI
jgi:hypothetical protein